MNSKRKIPSRRRPTIGKNPLDSMVAPSAPRSAPSRPRVAHSAPRVTAKPARRARGGGLLKVVGGLLLGLAVFCFLFL